LAGDGKNDNLFYSVGLLISASDTHSDLRQILFIEPDSPQAETSLILRTITFVCRENQKFSQSEMGRRISLIS
jgi:hypothetical protein